MQKDRRTIISIENGTNKKTGALPQVEIASISVF